MRLGACSKDRLFDDEHAIMPGGAAEKMLRTLPHEIPAQMREADEKRRRRLDPERQAVGMRLRCRTLKHSAILKTCV